MYDGGIAEHHQHNDDDHYNFITTTTNAYMCMYMHTSEAGQARGTAARTILGGAKASEARGTAVGTVF